MSKVLIFANSSGGLYGFRNELMRALGEKYEVVACTPDDGWMDRLRSVATVRILPMDRRGINPLRDMRLFLSYVRILKQEKPVMAITYTIKPNIYAGFACRLLNIPYAANITGLGTAFEKKGPLRFLVCKLYRTALKKSRVVFFENAANLDAVLKMGLIKEKQACVLAGAGVNLEYYAQAPYPPEEDETRFLFIGRIMKEKGVFELLSAISALHDEGRRVFLDIVGPYEEDLSAAIRALENKKIAAYHGETEDVRPYIARAHCFVLPSYHEGMANTLLESASMARPLLTSNIPGCREAVIENQSGYLFAPHDADSLKHAMRRFLALSHDERAHMGLLGRAHMENVFDKTKVVRQTLDRLCL